ncbi:MarR family winged helix-turn-helix transcriptional regulator [Actinomadura sp. HBU206391]|uniref:MarR family winged helix-turn-helix transcriptional regulator n=1 Tax=Actinomadura sp. HBU206391 TaxID=2731692 RepID=UPI00164FEDD8|nr:MarR family transcriptional regulator [Actinomadura sp. HBU206391]MBC6458974.1 MarR family transcriptional regulator [Actinomadura sp. HBU206391]
MGADDPSSDRRRPGAAAGGPISHAIFRLAKTHRMLAGQLLREVGLHPGQELLMMRLWESGSQRQADLATEFGTDSASMTRTVQRLERTGYVRRIPDPDDGRATRVEPTPASLVLRGQVERIWDHLERLTVGQMSTEEQQAALRVVQRLEDNLLALQSDHAPEHGAGR